MPPTRNPKQCPVTQTTRQGALHRPHPSRGGTRGYDPSVRQMALTVKFNGQEELQVFDNLRQQNLHPSKRTTTRWAT
jgi:hypothetical protein